MISVFIRCNRIYGVCCRPSPYREEVNGRVNGRRYDICHNRQDKVKTAHFDVSGQFFMANVDQHTRTKDSCLNACFEEEFRLYTWQPSPGHPEGEDAALDGTPIWLLLSVCSCNNSESDRVIGKVEIALTPAMRSPPAADNKDSETTWYPLFNDDRQLVRYVCSYLGHGSEHRRHVS